MACILHTCFNKAGYINGGESIIKPACLYLAYIQQVIYQELQFI